MASSTPGQQHLLAGSGFEASSRCLFSDDLPPFFLPSLGPLRFRARNFISGDLRRRIIAHSVITRVLFLNFV